MPCRRRNKFTFKSSIEPSFFYVIWEAIWTELSLKIFACWKKFRNFFLSQVFTILENSACENQYKWKVCIFFRISYNENSIQYLSDNLSKLFLINIDIFLIFNFLNPSIIFATASKHFFLSFQWGCKKKTKKVSTFYWFYILLFISQQKKKSVNKMLHGKIFHFYPKSVLELGMSKKTILYVFRLNYVGWFLLENKVKENVDINTKGSHHQIKKNPNL